MSPLGADHPPDWTSEWGSTEGVTSPGVGGGPRDRGAEGTSRPHSPGFRAAPPLREHLTTLVQHNLWCRQQLPKTSIAGRQLTDAAWHRTETDPGWFGNMLFQVGPKCSLLSHNDLHESLPRLMLFVQRAFLYLNLYLLFCTMKLKAHANKKGHVRHVSNMISHQQLSPFLSLRWH